VLNLLAKNLQFYMNENNLSQRELAKAMQVSQPTLSRIFNDTSQEIQPNTKRKFSNFFGFTYEELLTNKLSDLLLNTKNNKVKFIDFEGKQTNENIDTNEKYSFAMNIRDDFYAPLFPKGSILFFSKEPAFQKDFCLIKHKNKLTLCSIINSYRLELDVLDLYSDTKLSILRDSIVAVLMKSLNPN